MGRAEISGGFWGERLAMNRREAIFHQWEQLSRTGCLENFRIAAGRSDAFREGLFFADSDAYKWLDAASCILASQDDPCLRGYVEDLIDSIAAAQSPDGYLFTYNQILFPGRRWVNLQLEHELYCLGHLIEAGIRHRSVTGQSRLFEIACRAADLLVRDFLEADPTQVDGHEEIEIALIRLYRVTAEASYLELARRLLERRGRQQPYFAQLLPQLVSAGLRLRSVRRRHKLWRKRNPNRPPVTLPPLNKPVIPRDTWFRMLGDLLSGRNFQQQAPVREQRVPVGHAVRFAHLETAAAMLCRERAEPELRTAVEQAWEHMVRRRMYVTGGLGSLPLIEGFGRDYELDPEVAYAETCAAIGGMLWNGEMACLTNEPRYDDLFEWQLYNAASVGMGYDGRSYLYNNPLTCRGNIERVAWYLVPCCPSNLSRTWAELGSQVCRGDAGQVYVAQYLTGRFELAWGILEIDSGLPWDGRVRLTLEPRRGDATWLSLRLPSWSDAFRLEHNGEAIQADEITSAPSRVDTACGYAPHGARRLALRRAWRRGDVIELHLGMPIRLHRQDMRVPGCGGKDAISRGPLVYCLESADNGDGIFDAVVRRDSLAVVADPTLFGGIHTVTATTTNGAALRFLPYSLWGNRGAARMTVFVRTEP